VRSTERLHIAASADAVMAVLADPAFYLDRPTEEDIEFRELVRNDVAGDRVTLELRCAFVGELNAAARALLDPARLTWVQASEHDLATGRVAFRIVPDHYADRLRCRGRSIVTPDGVDASERVVETELRVRAPLVAGQVERALVDGLRRELVAQSLAIPDYVD
jgi:hypothetical protein